MEQHEFLRLIANSDPAVLAEGYLQADTVEVFPAKVDYDSFKQDVTAHVGATERVAIVGSDNWKYSLHPDKNFAAFHPYSDIDLAVVSPVHFQQT
jgi:hypothetical protein